MWLYLGLLSALFLGFHNLCKKHAVDNNTVLPVLFVTIIAGLFYLVPFFILSRFQPALAKEIDFFIPNISLQTHAYIFIKSAIMSASWVLAFSALKHLPITIVTPIRSAGPFFTFIGAIFLYNEQPVLLQWLGFFLVIFSVFLYARVGKKEGIHFKTNKWIYAIVAATFLGASSGLYDKFLVQYVALNPQTLQFWFCFYVAVILLFVNLYFFKVKNYNFKFKWRWSIPAVGILLQTADYFYFKALQDPEALIMLLSAVKRSQILIAVLVGGLIFKEKNRRKKLIPLAGVMIGVGLILYSN